MTRKTNEQRRMIHGGHTRINSVQQVRRHTMGHRAPIIPPKNRLTKLRRDDRTVLNLMTLSPMLKNEKN